MRKRRFVAAIALALAIAGCGEISNTIKPIPGTANQLTVELDYFPNADQRCRSCWPGFSVLL